MSTQGEDDSRKDRYQNQGPVEPERLLVYSVVGGLKSDLDSIRNEWHSDMQKWLSAIAQLEGEIQQIQAHDNQSARSQFSISKTGSNGLESPNLENPRRERLSLERELEEKISETRTLRTAWKRTAYELARLKSLEPRFSSNDDVIVPKWKTLQFSIKHLTSNNFRDSIYSKCISHHQSAEFRLLTPNWEQYFQDDILRPQMFQAYIWRWLLSNIFGQPGAIFGEDIFKALDTLNASISRFINLQEERNYTDYVLKLKDSNNLTKKESANWRAYTSSTLSKSGGISNRIIEQLSQNLGQRLLVLLPHFRRETMRNTLLDSTRDVICQAMELAKIFLCSIPSYQLHIADSWASHGSKVDERFVEVVGQYYSTMNIDLATSPYLLKKGNSFGENYEETMVLIKAEVLT